ncbi:MAG: Uma2 family endonuclease [Candidatus Poribacteria bacterium]|nr:Uma2 family endonuclease [Candidatus Poribacteria bacterium]
MPETMTADELLVLPDDGFRYELVKGVLRKMPPAGFDHGIRTMDLGARLHRYVKRNNIGRVAAAETGFQLAWNPDTVRAPDIAFVRRDRLPPTGQRGYFQGTPDLAVEVVSPGDSSREVEEKVADWLNAGTSLVWVVRPRNRTVTVYRSLTDVAILARADTLDGESVIPGFRCRVAEIFDE